MRTLSVNNWDVCPVCLSRAKEKAEDGYGELPEEEYNELKEKIEDPYDHFQTLREDWELSAREVDGDGYLKGWYGVSCDHCGFDETVQFDTRQEGENAE